MTKTISIFSLLLLTCLCQAEPLSLPFSKHPQAAYFLYDASQQLAYHVSELKPNRVYVVYAPALKMWVFTQTSAKGTLPNPIQAFAPGTIVNGMSLGGKPGERYELLSNAKWIQVHREVVTQQRVWSDRSPSSYNVWYTRETFRGDL